MTTTIQTTWNGTVLVLDAEFERRIEAAARVVGTEPTEFMARAVQRRCAEVLGEVATASGPAATTATTRGRSPAGNHGQDGQTFGQDRLGPWAIRPTPGRVLRTVAAASGLPIETVVGPHRGPAVARARTVAAYLLCNDAGLSARETARTIHRKSATVKRLTRSVAEVIGSGDPYAELLERARRLLRNGSSTGHPYPPLPAGMGDARFLPGLLARRLASGLTQPELAGRAGIARETLGRLERLQRRARRETVDALARALEVSTESLTVATRDLRAVQRSRRALRGGVGEGSLLRGQHLPEY